jgi:hypothetical protein
MIIEAVKKAKSSKQALDGAKFVLSGTPDYQEIFQACFEDAWSDATRRNRSIERNSGKNSDIVWKERVTPTEQEMKEDLREFLRFKNKTRVIGRILSKYDEQSLKQIFEMIKISRSQS